MRPWREYRGPRAGEVEAYLSRHCQTVTREKNADGTTEVRFKPSPCCGHAKRAAACCNASSGLWSCKACGKVGNWFTLTRTFGDPLSEHDRYKDGDMRIPWEPYAAHRKEPRRPVTLGHYPDLLSYCHFRGLSNKTLDAWRVTTKGPKTLRWPIYAWGDQKRWEMVNARMRVVIDRDASKTVDWFEVKGGPTALAIGNHLLGVDNSPSLQAALRGAPSQGETGAPSPRAQKRVLLFEGQWDAMTAWELGFMNALSLAHGASSVNMMQLLRYVPDDWEVWLAFDKDEPGQLAIERAFAQLGSERVVVLDLPHKDLNEWLMHEPDLTYEQVEATAVGVTETMRKRRDAEPMADAGSVGTQVSLKIQPRRRAQKPPPPNIIAPTPWPTLTELLTGGWMPKRTTGLLAPPGRGKTTVAIQCAVHAAMHGAHVGLVMLEDSRETVIDAIGSMVGNWCGEGADDTLLEEVASRIHLSRLEGHEVTWRECGDWFFDVAVDQFGARFLVMDNLDFLVGRHNDGNREKIEALAAYCKMVKLTESHMLIVWQPHKIDRKTIVNSGHQKGMAQALADADNYINLNWFGDLRRLEVEKNRFGGMQGNAHCWLVYNEQLRCLNEVSGDALKALRDKRNTIDTET